MVLPTLAALVLPLAVVTTGPLKVEDDPAHGTDPTTMSTTGTTDSTGGATDSDGGDTSTMPPVFEPCGCRSAGEGGAFAALALLFTAGAPCRRRRPTR